MAGIIKWKQNGERYEAIVGLLKITIEYREQNRYTPEAGYYIWVSGGWSHRKVKPFESLDTAKAAGIKLLRKEARDILKVVDATD